MNLALAGTIAAYIVIAVLLLSLNLKSSWKWWIKGAAIVLTTLFYAGSYAAITGMLGWPTRGRMPEHFQLLWSQVVEPDKASGDAGSIYLWVTAVDQNNVPSGRPRAFEFPYSDDLARSINGAQQKRDEGVDVAGTVEYGEKMDKNAKLKIGETNKNAEQTSRMDTVPFMNEKMRMSFEELPPVTLPPKPPL
jgi:hypothetical protein